MCASDPSPRLAGQPRGVRRFLRVWACLPLFAGYLPYYLCVGVSVVILWWLGDGDACGARVNDATWGHDDLEPRRHQRPRRDDFTPASTICATRSLVARFDSICGGNEGISDGTGDGTGHRFRGGGWRWEGRGGAGSGNTRTRVNLAPTWSTVARFEMNPSFFFCVHNSGREIASHSPCKN